MPKGKTGKPRGRPRRTSDPLRLTKDAIAIGFSAVFPKLTDTNIARLANRLADPLSTTSYEFRDNCSCLSLELPRRPGQASAENADRYTRARLRGTQRSKGVCGYTEIEAATIRDWAESVMMLAAKSQKVALSHALYLVSEGWHVAVVERLVTFVQSVSSAAKAGAPGKDLDTAPAQS